MIPVKFPEANVVFLPPKGMENCDPLHVFKTEDGRLVSCWELSDKELLDIITTRKVYLHIFGNGMPPVSLTVAE